MLFLLLACHPPAPAHSGGGDSAGDTAGDSAGHTGADSGADTSGHSGEDTQGDSGGDTGGDTGARSYWGQPVEPPLEPPVFVVENQRREQRDTDWLRGDPSVLWFFRDTGST